MADSVLVIDDDKELCSLLEIYLGDEGYAPGFAHDGVRGLEQALSGAYAIVILDVMLPAMNGLDVLRELRKSSDVPVIMLTARGEEVDRIVGLEIGADDYLPKPFNPRELTARLRSILRRSGRSHPPMDDFHYFFGDGLALDMTRKRLLRKGIEIRLTGMEFSLLAQLVTGAGKILSREVLCQRVLGREYSPLDRSLDVHISKLRKKLAPDQDVIRSVRGEGYCLSCAVERGGR